ncbi:MAG: molybdenum cofactor biosynthesis protein [Betaproteobacteria bacterium]
MKATIRALNLYPIKGCRGVALRAARLAATGLEHEEIGDREWVVVDEHGEFLSQRELPRMALIETRLTGTSMLLKAPGMLQLEVPYESEGEVVRVRVWDDTVSAVTQGEIADAWFTSFLGRPARLVRFDPEGRRLSNHRYTGKFDAPYKFADAFALLVTGQASLDDFNARLARQGHAAIAMERFRPNVVLDGLPAFDEDYAKTLRVDGATLRVVKPCARCTVPGVDPATGEASSVVPDLLATYRRRENGVMFGVNAIVVEGAGAWLAVGDEVEVELDL